MDVAAETIVQPDARSDEQRRTESKYQQAVAVWRGIDLVNLIPKLDSTAADIVAHQRDALVQRKDLAQKTKDFRKHDDATKLAETKGLLKSYQAFVDLLTGHGKTSSSAFLQLYSSLSEAPDPYPLLEASVDSLVLSEEVPKLTSEKGQLERRLQRVTGQLETAEKNVSEERVARHRLEEEQDRRAKEIEASWSAVLSEKENNWAAKEKALEQKADSSDRRLKEIKASYEVSQRLDRNDDNVDSRSAATAAELDIVSCELDKTSARLAEIEARNEQLRVELAQAAGQPSPRAIEDDPAFQRLETENAALLRKLDGARYDREAEQNSWQAKLRQAERATGKVTGECDELRARLDKYADYDEIRRELEMIRSIEFGGDDGNDNDDDDDDDDDDDAASNNKHTITTAAASTPSQDSLEHLLMTRNKKLSDELAGLRVSDRELRHQLDSAQAALAKTNAELERSRGLSATLENDLLRLQQSSTSSSGPAPSIAPTQFSRYPGGGGSIRRGRAVSPTSSLISGFAPPPYDAAAASAQTLDAIRAGEPVGGGSGILPMVQAQRDRFRRKNSELEEELSRTYALVRSLRAEVAALQRDNLALFEKSRVAGAAVGGGMYARGGAASSALGSRTSPLAVRAAADMEPDPEGSPADAAGHPRDALPFWSSFSAYSPFSPSSFSSSSRWRPRGSAARAYGRLSAAERAVYGLVRALATSRAARNAVAVYVVGLHVVCVLLVYLVVGGEADAGSRGRIGGIGPETGGKQMAGAAGH